MATSYGLDGPGLCGRSLVGVAGSNPAGGMDAYVVFVVQ